VTIEQSQVREALRGATAALSLTDQDVDRMEALLHAPIHRRRTSRFIAAAAAAIVVLAGILEAVAVSRRTNSLAPAAPMPVGGDIGVWKGIDAAFPPTSWFYGRTVRSRHTAGRTGCSVGHR
jgi:hypothetical protein